MKNEPAKTEPLRSITLEAVLPLSTGHIPENIAKHHMGAVSSMTGEYGWLVSCRDFSQRSVALLASGATATDVTAFVKVVESCQRAGADFILFDSDALVAGDLPTFDW